jgi:hypothetical protein
MHQAPINRYCVGRSDPLSISIPVIRGPIAIEKTIIVVTRDPHRTEMPGAIDKRKDHAPKRGRWALRETYEVESKVPCRNVIGEWDERGATRRWARRRSCPRAPHDQRATWAYIFGALCPAEGKGAGLAMPWCDTEAMRAHFGEISTQVARSSGE